MHKTNLPDTEIAHIVRMNRFTHTDAERLPLPSDTAFPPMLPTCYVLWQSGLLTDPSALNDVLLDHLGTCMNRAYGTSSFPWAGCSISSPAR